jgi:hypothetical protein
MNSRLLVWLLLAAALALPLRSAEQNVWPFRVSEVDEHTGQADPQNFFGPLLERRTGLEGRQVQALRPLFLHTAQGEKEASYLLYPFFTWRKAPGYSSFSFFDLVNDRQEDARTGRGAVHGLDLWPFYFSRETGDPATSYSAFFPVGGTIKHRFGDDRLTWAAFPLYLQTEKSGRSITYAPWPIVRVISGAGHQGFELWPLFGARARAGDYRERFVFWPLFYLHESHLSAAQPTVEFGALPFYTSETGPGYRNVNILWPLFGAMHRTEPARYDETRYLWPFLVQGRGTDRYVNRWGPVYSHSVIKGYDKTWLLWPLYRHATWREAGLDQEQNRLLWFIYWSLEQRDPRRPAAAPAYKRHLWPLFSAWDNGAGRRQIQLLSPLEVFFPGNDVVRELYSPLFAVYRYDQSAPDDRRGKLLWGLISWHDSPTEKEFHLGPLLGERFAADREARVALLAGVLSWRRDAGTGRWRFLMFDFNSRSATKGRPAPATP